MLGLILFLLASSLLLLTGGNAQSCALNNVFFVEAATFSSTTIDQCQSLCQANPNCKFFTWNTLTQGCGIRTFDFGGFVDAPTQHTGTPYSTGFASNKVFVGKVARGTTISQCAQSCLGNSLCNSWTWYNQNNGNASNICIQNYEQPTTQLNIPGPTVFSSGLKSCQNVLPDCTSFVNSSTCCSSYLPFVKNCGTDQRGTSGNIRSPNYPSPYNNRDACVWNINAPAGTTINLDITAFVTESNFERLFILLPQSCNYANGNYLTGNVSPQSITIPQNTASLYFYSDTSVTLPGFNINWSAVSTITRGVAYVNSNICCPSQAFVKNCGSNQSGLSGIIQSPNYPNPYGNNNYCEWTITSPPGTRVLINLSAFNTEAFYDRLFILRSGSFSPVVPYLSGPATTVSVPRQITVDQNTASIYFYSDGSVTTSGFSFSWQAQ